jgi:CRP/FNR family cyclic AMP-dependent transcriptional regulator
VASNNSVISVLEVDPELAEGLPPEARGVAIRHAIAQARLLPEGEWQPLAEFGADPPQIGLLVIDGLLTRELTFAGRTSTELLGVGDVLRPWDLDVDEMEPLAPEVHWFVHEPVRLAILDHRFAAVAVRWPTLIDAIIGRSMRRSRSLAFQLAISQVTRVDGRLLVLLWQLAERWGRVGPDGVRLPLQLTHHMLGTLVGARRPSVTTALSGLAREGLVERTPSGWLLHGDPEDALAELLENHSAGNGRVASAAAVLVA